MAEKEAKARIKINKLLEAPGWRFFAEGGKPANIQLEPCVKVKPEDIASLGEDFEKTDRAQSSGLAMTCLRLKTGARMGQEAEREGEA